MNVDVIIKHHDLEIPIKFELEKNKPHVIDVGEEQFADRLFAVLCGLEDIKFSDDVLGLGDKTMFVNGTIYKNIYKVLRIRFPRKESKEKTEQVIELYKLDGKKKIKSLSDSELYEVALARSYYRQPELVVINKNGYLSDVEIDVSRWDDCYVVCIH